MAEPKESKRILADDEKFNKQNLESALAKIGLKKVEQESAGAGSYEMLQRYGQPDTSGGNPFVPGQREAALRQFGFAPGSAKPFTPSLEPAAAPTRTPIRNMANVDTSMMQAPKSRALADWGPSATGNVDVSNMMPKGTADTLAGAHFREPPQDVPAPPKPSVGGGPAGPAAPTAQWTIPEEARAEWGKAFGQSGAAQQELGEAQMAGAKGEAGLRSKQAELQAIHGEMAAMDAERHQQMLQEKMGKLDKMAERVAAESVDPNRVWNNKSTAEKIQFHIGSVLGSLFSGLAAGGSRGATGPARNPAMDQLNQIIARDIDAQEKNLAHKHTSLADARGLLADSMKVMGNERDAKFAAWNLSLTAYETQLKAEAAKFKSPEIHANMMKSLADIQKEKAALYTQYFRLTAPATGGGGGMGKNVGAPDELVIPLGNGTGMLANTKEEGTKARHQLAATAEINQNLALLKALDQSYTTSEKMMAAAHIPFAKEQERNRLLADTRTKVTVNEGQGAMSKGDAANTNEAVGALSGMGRFTGATPKLLDAAMQSNQRSVQNTLSSQTGRIVQMGQWREDAKGNTVPHNPYLPGVVHAPQQPGGGEKMSNENLLRELAKARAQRK